MIYLHRTSTSATSERLVELVGGAKRNAQELHHLIRIRRWMLKKRAPGEKSVGWAKRTSSAYSQPECFEREDNVSESLTVRLCAIVQGKRRLRPEASSCAGDLCARKPLRGLQRKSTNTEGEKRLKESVRNEVEVM